MRSATHHVRFSVVNDNALPKHHKSYARLLFIFSAFTDHMNLASNTTVKDSSTAPARRPRVIIITGPTSVGKSATALALCQRVNGEIISADSVQVYRHLNVGSNKASVDDRRAVPHHLLDIVDPTDEFTAGDFFRAARASIALVVDRQALPVVVGGTMMYVRWLIHGRPATPRTTEDARHRVEEAITACKGNWNDALSLLAARDPQRAAALSRNDWYRLTRALEVVETVGIPMTEIPLVGAAPQAPQSTTFDYDFRCIFLFGDRLQMNRAIDRRCEMMILPSNVSLPNGDLPMQSILIEVADLLTSARLRVAAASPCLAIGYRQTVRYLVQRALSFNDFTQNVPDKNMLAFDAFRAYLDDFQQATRNYAKQQLAWFRKDDMFHWVRAGPDTVDEIERIANKSEADYHKLREFAADMQRKFKDEIVTQGKRMKTYTSQQTWLIRGSDAESRAVGIGEEHARHIATRIEEHDLKRILQIISQ